LQYPDFSKEFDLTTDASNEGVGAVLSHGPIGKDLPVGLASPSLNRAETHHTTSEKELLAIVWATKYFRPHLYGRKFKIVSDYKPLVWVMNVKDPGSRLMRWTIQLAEYDNEIVHKRRTQNTNADALSRIGSAGRVKERRDIPDENTKEKQILYESHYSTIGGHKGMNRIYYVCAHQRTLLSTLTTDLCAVTMLQRKNSLPSVCDNRLVRFSNAVWTQLTNNSWIYFAPHPDIMTMLCDNNNPVDVCLKGVGKLEVYPGCKGCSASIVLHGSSIIANTSAQIRGDLVSQIDLQYACCEELGVKENFSQLPVEVA